MIAKYKNILIAGGAGFLGSHLCERLLKEGHHVICIDHLSTGSKQNLKNCQSYNSFELVVQDICDPIDLKIDEIYNLACPASPVQYQADPIYTLKTNVIGTLNLLELAVRFKARFLQASTSEVYGDPTIHPQSESYWGNVNPIGIRSCYDEGKRCAETLCFDFHRKFRLSIKIARIFNTYGPRMLKNDGRVVSNFIVQALNNEPLTVFGKGDHTRSFCFVDDLIDGLIRLMNSGSTVTGPINLGNPEEHTVLALAHQIIQMTRSSSKVAFLPLPEDDPKKRKPDIALAKAILKWEPKVSLSDGLDRTVKYFKQLII